MNERWNRNLYSITALENKIKQNEESIRDLSFDLWLDYEDTEAERKALATLNEDLSKEIENLKKPFEELVEEAKRDLLELYLDETDKRPWAIAWSGGKDSTTVMGLVVSMLESLPPEKRWRPVYAVMSDTMMENPNLESYMHDQVIKLNTYAKEKNIPISSEIVFRKPEHSYFYLILGKGYFLPQNNGRGRWCTDRLKLMPQNEKLRQIDPSFILIGVRLSESSKRRQSIKKWSDNDNLNVKIGDHVALSNSNTFMPIVDFTIEDVWAYLQRERLGWSSTHEVRKLYRDATGECGFTNPKGTEVKASQSESCGARFGCWTCPVILKDRSTEEMSKNNEWMAPLSDFRMMQLRVMGDYQPNRPEGQRKKLRTQVLRQFDAVNNQIKCVTKSGYKMDGRRMIDKKGVVRDDQGALTVEARKYLFDHLMATQYRVNRLREADGLEPIELIKKDEIQMIKDRWAEDESERPWLITNAQNIPITKLDELIEVSNEIEANQPITV